MDCPDQICPACGKFVDTAAALIREHMDTSPGDVSICAYCGEILVFAPDLSLRKMGPTELFTDYAKISEDVIFAQFVIRSYPRGK